MLSLSILVLQTSKSQPEQERKAIEVSLGGCPGDPCGKGESGGGSPLKNFRQFHQHKPPPTQKKLKFHPLLLTFESSAEKTLSICTQSWFSGSTTDLWWPYRSRSCHDCVYTRCYTEEITFGKDYVVRWALVNRVPVKKRNYISVVWSNFFSIHVLLEKILLSLEHSKLFSEKDNPNVSTLSISNKVSVQNHKWNFFISESFKRKYWFCKSCKVPMKKSYETLLFTFGFSKSGRRRSLLHESACSRGCVIPW